MQKESPSVCGMYKNMYEMYMTSKIKQSSAVTDIVLLPLPCVTNRSFPDSSTVSIKSRQTELTATKVIISILIH